MRNFADHWGKVQALQALQFNGMMCRFDLLTRVRIAHQFGTLEGRRWLVRCRLQAFHVMFQCNPSPQMLSDFYAREPEFVSDLVSQ